MSVGQEQTEVVASNLIWGSPKIGGTLLGVPIIRTIVFWGLYWVPPILGNYHIKEPARICTAFLGHLKTGLAEHGDGALEA